MDYLSEQIAQYEIRESIPYQSAAYQVGADFGPWGVPYWTTTNPLQFGTLNTDIIAAPPPPQKSVIFHHTPVIRNAGQFMIAQAPTSGIYTGVEDSCT